MSWVWYSCGRGAHMAAIADPKTLGRSRHAETAKPEDVIDLAENHAFAPETMEGECASVGP